MTGGVLAPQVFRNRSRRLLPPFVSRGGEARLSSGDPWRPIQVLRIRFFPKPIEARTLSHPFLQMIQLTSIVGGCSGAFSRIHIGGVGGGLSMDSFSDGLYGYGVRSSLSPGSASKEKA